MKKSIVTVVAFMLFALASLQSMAQDKHQYAIVRLYTPFRGGFGSVSMTISTHDGTTDLPVDKAEKVASLIKYVESMEAQGWEVYNTAESASDGGTLVTYFLKKDGK